VAGRYRLLELVGTGSMGRVYLGERLGLKRRVAIKFLHKSLARNPKFRQRFERELTIMSQLDHPNCVSMLDYGVDRAPFVVMDFIEGCTLQSLIAEGGITVPEALELGRQLLCGLAHAHRLGIVHRDIKPANLIVGHPTGTGALLRIVDFGLAKVTEAGDDTSPNLAIGTPSYMSPEQTEARRVDARSDVYSAGVVMFELLTGRRPFIAEDTLTLLEMHRHAPMPSLERICPDLPAAAVLEPILARALAKDPADRYPTAIEFADALASALASTAPAESEPVVSEPAPAPALDTLESHLPSRVRASRRGLRLFALLLLASLASAGTLYADEVRALADRIRVEVHEWVDSDAPAQEALAQRGPRASTPLRSPTRARAAVPSAPIDSATELPTYALVEAEVDDATVPPVDRPPVFLGEEAPSPLVPEPADLVSSGHDAPPAPAIGSSEDVPVELELAVHDVPVEVRSVADVERLLAQGDRESALAGLDDLLRKRPKSASLHYLRGKLYFEQRWWTDALKSYTLAIENNRGYRENRRIIRHGIEALGSSRSRAHARQLLRHSVGKAALAPLASAAKKHRNANVRREAERLVKELRRAPTKRPRRR